MKLRTGEKITGNNFFGNKKKKATGKKNKFLKEKELKNESPDNLSWQLFL